jgi:hypothetical protein
MMEALSLPMPSSVRSVAYCLPMSSSAEAEDPRLSCVRHRKPWVAAPSAAMTLTRHRFFGRRDSVVTLVGDVRG